MVIPYDAKVWIADGVEMITLKLDQYNLQVVHVGSIIGDRRKVESLWQIVYWHLPTMYTTFEQEETIRLVRKALRVHYLRQKHKIMYMIVENTF